MKLSDLEDAFLFVGGAAFGTHTAMVCPSTGQICLHSEFGDLDEVPEEAYDSDSWFEVPHKNELGLGSDLVTAFVVQNIPADLDRVRQIFRKRGAYSNFKDLLDSRGILEKWYTFEDTCLKEAILQWCRDFGIEVTE
jgi:hypothetical protein